MRLSQIVLSLALSSMSLIGLEACGPVNGAAPVPGSAAGATACNNAANAGATDAAVSPETVGFSKKHAFIVLARPKAAPQVGDNNYTMRIVRGADLGVSKTAKVTVTFIRTNDKIQPPVVHTVNLQPQDDGSYAFVLTLKHGGNFEIHTSIVDGDVQDDHVVAFSI